MALQVWLPLTGNLKNLGLDDITVTNNGATINTAGKIGSCYDGTTSGQTIIVTVPDLATMLSNGKKYTFTCWAKMNSAAANTNQWIVKLGTNTCGFWWGYSSPRFVWNENNNGTRVADGETTAWHHFAVVVDKTVSGRITIWNYMDGTPVSGRQSYSWDSSSQAQPAGNTITIYPYIAFLNDLRIYDNCLSPKEVKELSKGLVAHYPLNDGIGGVNILKDSHIEKSGAANVAQWFRWNLTTTLSTNTIYTISFDAKTTVTTDVFYIGWANGDNTQELLSSGVEVIQSYKRYSFTGSTTKTNINSIIISNYKGYGRGNTNNTNGVLSVKNVKLELGEKPTPWIPNSADALYSKMGLDNGIIYDCSGYGHDGNVVGSISINSEAPRYAVSSSFSGSEQILAESPTAEAKSASLWIYIPSIGTNNLVFADYKSKLAFGFYSSYIITAVTGDNNYRTTYESSLLTNNSWHHIVIVKSEPSGMELWIDGVKQTPRSGYDAWSPGMSDGLTIGARTNGNNKYIGSISDLRIYATVLSAEDIKSLYETAASIDDHGNVYGYELEEV